MILSGRSHFCGLLRDHGRILPFQAKYMCLFSRTQASNEICKSIDHRNVKKLSRQSEWIARLCHRIGWFRPEERLQWTKRGESCGCLKTMICTTTHANFFAAPVCSSFTLHTNVKSQALAQSMITVGSWGFTVRKCQLRIIACCRQYPHCTQVYNGKQKSTLDGLAASVINFGCLTFSSLMKYSVVFSEGQGRRSIVLILILRCIGIPIQKH